MGIAYIFCSYKDPSQTTVNLIASVLQQLIQTRSLLSDEVLGLYNSHINKRTTPSLAKYSKILQSEAHHFSKLFIVIDALDEYTENNDIRNNLLAELKKLQPTLYLMITTRPHVKIPTHIFPYVAPLEICASDEDIKIYVKSRIMTSDVLQAHTKKDQELEDKIITTIMENVKGM